MSLLCESEACPSAASCRQEPSVGMGNCDEPFDPVVSTADNLVRYWPWWVKSIAHGWYQAQSFCLDQLKQEPERLLLIGGCRQRGMAEYLAFAFPNTQITLLDPDAATVAAAEAAIHCRFRFLHTSLEDIPLTNNSIDLVIAHQLPDYVTDWPAAIDEISRITRRHLLLSVSLPYRRAALQWLPGVRSWFKQEGVGQQTPSNWMAMLALLRRYGKLTTYLEPLPWRMVMVNMHPVREERLAWPVETLTRSFSLETG